MTTGEKKAKEDISKIISSIAESIKKSRDGYINEMVESMKVQSDIISRAAKEGIIIRDILPEIQEAYKKHTEELDKE